MTSPLQKGEKPPISPQRHQDTKMHKMLISNSITLCKFFVSWCLGGKKIVSIVGSITKTLIILISCFILFFACSTLKTSDNTDESIPDWVKQKPQSPFYYIGVSSSPKRGFSPGEYIQSAQQRALANLASEISVNIESKSMLSIIEINYNISENFSSDITATTSMELEEYELFDTWEDNDNYWVYYRLSREKYLQLRQEKKNKAIEDAKNKYFQAQKMIDKKMHINAYKLFADALADIKLYLGESTLTEINGQEADLGNFIFSEIIRFFNDIKIDYPENEITIKRGVEIHPDLVTFRILDKNDNPVQNMPFRINFSGSGLLRNIETSDSEGKIICAMKQISSVSNFETLNIGIDMPNLARTSTDHMTRNILRNIPAPERSVRIIIKKPAVYINSDEKEFDNELEGKPFKNAIISNTGRDFNIVDDKDTADYIITIQSNTTEKGVYLSEYYITISCIINLTDKQGNNLFQRNIRNDYTGRDFNNASQTAYQSVSRTIERSITRDIVNAVFF